MTADQITQTEKKIPVYKKVIVVLSVMATIAGTLTGIMTWANLGFSDAFLAKWGQSFGMAMTVMMPIAIVLIGIFSKIIARAFPNMRPLPQAIIVGVIASIVMQSIMALLTSFNAVGLEVWADYRAGVINAFITAFPYGLIMALIMTTIIKPRLLAYVKS
ncbi:DUF2798 domain-containing protein [Candidatus Terasakiella magnetica]|nr:DUF2798 domain-containing protein [Candidatus Terasakiella magnetica]